MGEPLRIAPRPRRLQVLTVTGYSSLPSGFVEIVLFVVDLVLGFRSAPNRVGAVSTRIRRRAGIALPAGHAVQARKSDSALAVYDLTPRKCARARPARWVRVRGSIGQSTGGHVEWAMCAQFSTYTMR